MLATNMIRKDLNSQNQYDAGVALSGLSCFISGDLSRDLANDIMTLVSILFAIQLCPFYEKKIDVIFILDELNKTISSYESCVNDVQSFFAISGSVASSLSEIERKIRGSRSR